jgi:hypothetical protein
MVSAVVGVLLAACSAAGAGERSTTSSSGGEGASTAAGTGGGTSTTGGAASTAAGTGGGISFDGGLAEAGAGCDPETQFIYTITSTGSLYRFDPAKAAFALIGTPNCPSTTRPYSMAVDRGANAWVVFTDGHLFKIDTKTTACALVTSFVPGQQGFTTFGMGFSADAPGSSAETLYVSEANFGQTGMQRLGTIDLQTLTLTPIGAYDALHERAELTGTGDAKLYGAFEGTPYVVAEIEKTDAKILSQAPQTPISVAPNTGNFAFAFWAGDFFVFVGQGRSTSVFRYQPSNGTTTLVQAVAFAVVGAGVSTCAPFEPQR